MSTKSLLSIAIESLDCGYSYNQTTVEPDCARDKGVTCKLFERAAYCPKYGFMLAWARYAKYVFFTSDESEVVSE